MQTYRVHVKGEEIPITLYSLDEYCAISKQEARELSTEYVGAAVVGNDGTGLSAEEVLEAAGTMNFDYDESRGMYLLTVWPSSASPDIIAGVDLTGQG
ncbi:MAG: hypothetical protein M0Z94_13995 [Dehalococcoidales bacterium]|nr:hypothetical protein [Dehalococcoidales bacterium]